MILIGQELAAIRTGMTVHALDQRARRHSLHRWTDANGRSYYAAVGRSEVGIVSLPHIPQPLPTEAASVANIVAENEALRHEVRMLYQAIQCLQDALTGDCRTCGSRLDGMCHDCGERPYTDAGLCDGCYAARATGEVQP